MNTQIGQQERGKEKVKFIGHKDEKLEEFYKKLTEVMN